MLRKVTVVALSALLATSFGAPTWAATGIGVTSAVLPNARGTPPDQDSRILQVGNDMYADERVQTVDNGKVHLLFLDGSAMSIGPNSDIVLDEFVYDPDTKTGNLSFAATKGVFRFVGGRISKSSPVLIKTPNATIGIRGGVALVTIGAVITATLIYGDELTVQVGNITRSLTTPGFRLEVDANGDVGQPVAASSEELGGSLDELEGTQSQTADTRNLITNNDVATSQIGNLGSGQTPTAIGPTDNGQAQAAGTAVNGDDLNNDAEVADSTEVNLGQDNPDAGGGGAVAGNLVGLYRHANVRTNGTDVDASLDDLLNNGTIVSGQANAQSVDGFSQVAFPVSTTPAGTASPGAGSYLDFDTTATTSSPFGAIVPGTSFVADSGEFAFVFADETNFSGHGAFAFLGAPTPSSAIPSTGFAVYSLRRDLFLNGDNPFIPEVDGGNFGLGAQDSGRAFINWAPNGAGERAFVEITPFYRSLGAGQMSQTSVAPGRIVDDGAGKLHLMGEMRASLRATTTAATRTIYYSSAISSQDAADGSDFFGTSGPNFFVLGSQKVSATDVINTSQSGIDRIVGGVGSTSYDANLPAAQLAGNGPSDDPTRIAGTQTLRLEFGGISSEFAGSGQMTFARIQPSETDVATSNILTLNGTTGAINAFAVMRSLDVPEVDGLVTAKFGWGGNATATSAFVSNDEFGAVEVSSVVNDVDVIGDSELYFHSLDLRFVNLLSNVGLTPCTCEFLKIGLWGGYAQDAAGNSFEFHQVPWVAGPMVTAADFPTTGTATYTGNAVAQVYNAVDSATPQIYTAFGTFNASVTFAPGMVTLNDVDMSIDGASITNLTGGANPNTQRFFPFSGTGSRVNAGGLAVNGNARFTGTSGQLQNMYGSYAAANAGGTYRQSGAFGAD
ncbi:MAG: FecR domain-containing protein [Alphaproteobacteria bacterium]